MALEIKIKKLYEDAVLPKYAKSGDAGMDLVAISHEVVNITDDYEDGPRCLTHHALKDVFGTGLAMEIPTGYVGLIFPRSSIHKTGQMLTNCVGVIDSGYRGEIKFVFRRHKLVQNLYKIGDRIGQIMILPYPQISFKEVSELTASERGEGGFGSTGN